MSVSGGAASQRRLPEEDEEEWPPAFVYAQSVRLPFRLEGETALTPGLLAALYCPKEVAWALWQMQCFWFRQHRARRGRGACRVSILCGAMVLVDWGQGLRVRRVCHVGHAAPPHWAGVKWHDLCSDAGRACADRVGVRLEDGRLVPLASLCEADLAQLSPGAVRDAVAEHAWSVQAGLCQSVRVAGAARTAARLDVHLRCLQSVWELMRAGPGSPAAGRATQCIRRTMAGDAAACVPVHLARQVEEARATGAEAREWAARWQQVLEWAEEAALRCPSPTWAVAVPPPPPPPPRPPPTYSLDFAFWP